MGSARQGVEEPAIGELVVGARRGRRRDGVDAQLRPDPAHPAEVGGRHVQQWRSEAAFYAGNALSTTMPGGPVLSATFIYRQQRMWGASPVVASWQLVMSGVLQVVGLALLGLGGAFLLGASKNPLSLIFTLGGFVALLVLAQAVASNPQQIDGIGVRVLSWFNSLRGKPADTGLDKWREILDQLESVSLSRRDLGDGVQLVAVQLGRRRGVPGVRRLRRGRQAVTGRPDRRLRGGARGRLDPADAGRAAGRRGGAGARPGVQRDDAGLGDLGDADLPAGQLDLHLGDRLGGVLLHVPHREGHRPRRRTADGRRRAARLSSGTHRSAATRSQRDRRAAGSGSAMLAARTVAARASTRRRVPHDPTAIPAPPQRRPHRARRRLAARGRPPPCSPAWSPHPCRCPPPTARSTWPTSCS